MEPNKRIRHKQQTLAQGKDFRRWRLWCCVEGSESYRWCQSGKEIYWLRSKGFRAKVWAPRPEHKTSGHTHVVVLCTFTDLCKLQGIEVKIKKEMYPPKRKSVLYGSDFYKIHRGENK